MPEPASSKPGFSAGRRWVIALNAVLGVLALLAIVVMVNFVAAGHVARFQWARHSPFKLSAQTLKVLGFLTNEVSATICFDPQNKEDIYNLTLGLLGEYQNSNPRLIHVKQVDYTRFPGEAKALMERIHLSGLTEKDFVAFESNGRSKVFYAGQLADYDLSDLISGKSKIVRRKAFKGEMYFTSAIFALNYTRAINSYFIYGHGEGDPGDPSGQVRKVGDTGYSKLAAILKDEINSDWQRLYLQGTNTIPADCQLLIVGGPHNAQFETNEVDKIQAYLKHGGRLLLLLDQACGLGPLMASWGVALGKYPVIEGDPQLRIYGDQGFLAELVPHPITNPLNREQLGLLLLQPHPVVPYGNAAKRPGGPDVKVLAMSSQQATNGGQLGPFTLICAIEQGVVKDLNTPQAGGTRILVVGDPFFLDDQMIDTYVANHYFAGLALNWLLERPDFLLNDLSPWAIKEYKLELTGAQIRQLRWLFLGAMPGAVLLVGGLVWLRRRS
jgi:hypothetical protein